MRRDKRKARKRHFCDWCGGPILPGNEYWDFFDVIDGEPNPWKSHLDCQTLAEKSPFIHDGMGPFGDWDPDDDLETEEDRAEFARLVERAKFATSGNREE